MKAEYNALLQLRQSQGYGLLQGLWALQHQKIISAIRKAGKGNKETSWRYFAGQQEGFELAITQLERAIVDMEKENEDLAASTEAAQQVEELLKQVKGDKP